MAITPQNLNQAYRQGYGEAVIFDTTSSDENMRRISGMALAKQQQEKEDARKQQQDLFKNLKDLGNAFDADQKEILQSTQDFIDKTSQELAKDPKRFQDPLFKAEIDKYNASQLSKIAQSKQQRQEYDKVLNILTQDKKGLYDQQATYTNLEKWANPSKFPELEEEIKSAGSVQEWRNLNREKYLRPEVAYDHNKYLDEIFKGKVITGQPIVTEQERTGPFGKKIITTDVTVPFDKTSALQAVMPVLQSPDQKSEKFRGVLDGIVSTEIKFDTEGLPILDQSSPIGKRIIQTAIELYGPEELAANPQQILQYATAVEQAEVFAKEIYRRTQKVIGKPGGGLNITLGGGGGGTPTPDELGLVEGIQTNITQDGVQDVAVAILSDNTSGVKAVINYGPEFYTSKGEKIDTSGSAEMKLGASGVYKVYTKGPKAGQRVPESRKEIDLGMYEYRVMGSAIVPQDAKFGSLSVKKDETVWAGYENFYPSLIDKASKDEKVMLAAKKKAFEEEARLKNEELKELEKQSAAERAAKGEKIETDKPKSKEVGSGKSAETKPKEKSKTSTPTTKTPRSNR